MLLIKIFKKKDSALSDERSAAILNKWKAFKQNVANKLQEKFELLSTHAKKYVLISFCVLFGGSSVTIVILSITTATAPLRITGILRPEHAYEQQSPTPKRDSVITKQEYDRIIMFENYLLGLRSNSAGKKKYDSIMQCRSKLIDSIAMFRRMYLSQNKK